MSELLKAFETYLKANLPKAPSFHPHYEKALGEMLLAGGKRFRAALVLAAATGFDENGASKAMSVALAVETFHTYSLIHDDLPAMDDADFRRSAPTLHKSYDEVTAILVGDALNTHSFSLLANAPLSSEIKIKLVAILAENGGARGMVLGQALDCHFENKKLNTQEVEFIHRAKTGRLIAASLQMGAYAGGANDAQARDLYDFGMDLGLYFQIRDDIIDATQESAAAGKPTRSDAHKNSFVTLLGIDEAQNRAKAEAKKLREAIAATQPTSLSIALDKALGGYLLP
ncbi:MAG: polyprenyl synthetase family protein [Helicobacteraceae bacterium]|jgi:farnesyl diphosphate synthase|nr:polyprenyl synthetase family protein [Helicobacteraceae bacterium]